MTTLSVEPTDLGCSVLPVALECLVGAQDVERTEAGHRPWRLPRWARDQIVDAGVRTMAGMPAGVRLELITDAAWLELEVHVTVLPATRDRLSPAVFDLVVDGQLTDTHSTVEGTQWVLDDARTAWVQQPGGPTTVRFALPGIPGTRVELWLPHTALVELRGVRVPQGSTVVPAPRDRPTWVHHGSSISQCQEALSPTGTWPALVARQTGVALQSLGFSGQCHLDQFAARTIRDLDADAISIKCGINILNADSMRERAFVPALHGFLDTIRDRHARVPILLVSPIYCPAGEASPGPTLGDEHGLTITAPRPADLAHGALTLQRMRQLIAHVVTSREDPHLHYVDGLELLGEADAARLPDHLHPDPEGYRLIADRFVRLAFGAARPFSGLGVR